MNLSQKALSLLLACLGMATLLLASSLAQAGWGVSSEFLAYSNSGFEFAMSYPRAWEFRERTAAGEHCARWECFQEVRFQAENIPSERRSWVTTRFFAEVGISTMEALQSALLERHRELKLEDWKRRDDGTYAPRLASREIAGSRPEEVVSQTYYLVGPGRVVQLETHAFPEGNGPYWVETMRASVNAASDGPEIQRLESEKGEYEVGEVATFHLTVADIPGTIMPGALQNFELEADSASKAIKRTVHSVLRDGKRKSDGAEQSRFSITVRVLPHFASDGLLPRAFSVMNTSNGATFCRREGLQYKCSTTRARQFTLPLPKVRVRNEVPDSEGPEILDAQLNSQSELTLSARDSSEISYARLILGSDISLIVFPDEIGESQGIPLSRKGRWGRNVIREIHLFDANGFAAVLKSGDKDHYDCQRTVVTTDAKGQRVPHLEGCVARIPVITFLGGKP